MKILVTGATGFVGKYLIPILLSRGHDIRCVSRSKENALNMPWYSDVSFSFQDVDQESYDSELFDDIDVLIHLAWSDLGDFKSRVHIEKNLPNNIRFLRAAIESGIKQIMVSGTCLEYGMHNGELDENQSCNPVVSYAIAKDLVRRYLKVLQSEFQFTLQWVRLFYVFGLYQSPKSLLSQLEDAIASGEKTFNMSKGDQLRDFIAIEEASFLISQVVENREFDGIVNCSSGSPMSVREFVENKLVELNKSIELNLGFYPYPEYEPMAFWGSNEKLNEIIKASKSND